MKKLLRRLFDNFIVRPIRLVYAGLLQEREKSHFALNLHNVLRERAMASSADFVEQHLSNSMIFRSKVEMWNYVAQKLLESGRDGIAVEFGVASGKSINYLSSRVPAFKFYGFDSFEGLAEDWLGHHATKGTYSQNGRLPAVNANVMLIKGWFDSTVPKFVKAHDLTELAFVHIDSDTYEAAMVIFENVGPSFRPGLLVLFDELIGYPNWQQGEIRALHEASQRFGFAFEYVAFTSQQALIRVV